MYAPISDPPRSSQSPAPLSPAGWSSSRPTRRPIDPWPAAAAVLAALWATWMLQLGPAVTPDSIHYLSTTQHLVSGHGFIDGLTELHDPRSTVPFTPWPPLYPSVLALVVHLGAESPLAAGAIVNVIAVGLGVFGMWDLGRRAAGTGAGRAAAVAYAGLFPTAILASFLWSEALYLALLIAAAGRLAAAIADDRRATGNFLLAGALLGLAASTRYIGFAAAAAATAAVFALHAHAGVRRAAANAIFVAVPASLPIVLIVGRNRALTGHWFGDVRPPGDQGYADALVDAASAIARDFAAPLHPLGGPVAAGGAAAMLLAAGIVFVRLLQGRSALRAPDFDRASGVPMLYAWLAAAHIGAVLHSVVSVRLDPVNTRYLAGAYPFLLVLLILGARALAFSDRRGPGRRTAPLYAAIALALFLLPHLIAGAALAARGAREERTLTAPYWTSRLGSPAVWAADRGLSHLAKLAPPDAPVITNAWELVLAGTGLPVKPLPAPDEAALIRRMRDYPGAIVAVRRGHREYRLTASQLRTMAAEGFPVEPLRSAGDWAFFRVCGDGRPVP